MKHYGWKFGTEVETIVSELLGPSELIRLNGKFCCCWTKFPRSQKNNSIMFWDINLFKIQNIEKWICSVYHWYFKLLRYISGLPLLEHLFFESRLGHDELYWKPSQSEDELFIRAKEDSLEFFVNFPSLMKKKTNFLIRPAYYSFSST